VVPNGRIHANDSVRPSCTHAYKRHADSLDGAVFDMLTTLGDFTLFKEWVVNFNQVRNVANRSI
jgi:hypothetical protein